MTAKLEQVDASKILDALIHLHSSGTAENEPEDLFLKRFLPLPDHGRALEPAAFLIIGGRGAGKSALFQALQYPAGIRAIMDVAPKVSREQIDRTTWLVGYSSRGTDFPAEMVIRKFSRDRTAFDFQLLWLGLLLRCLHRSKPLLAIQGGPLQFMLNAPSVSINDVFGTMDAATEEGISLLDRCDKELLEKDKWAFVTYDELDKLCASDWESQTIILRGLIQFWSGHARRWQRLRPKIFLRKDLFERALAGTDVSKISAQRVELNWTVRGLYALLAKRLVNQDALLKDYLREVLPDGKEYGELGWRPTAPREEEYRSMIEKMCGPYMGVNPKKGRTFLWIPKHLEDSNGRVLPRSMIRLFESAAEMERDAPRAEWPRIIHYTALRGALDKVSVDRFNEIKEEFLWIEKVRMALKPLNIKVPAEKLELQRALDIDWSQEPNTPPERGSYGLLQFLGELGIFYIRSDGRVDVRDIFLDGLGLKRKGGVKKPF
jgi:hypothetical protein